MTYDVIGGGGGAAGCVLAPNDVGIASLPPDDRRVQAKSRLGTTSQPSARPR